jgi:hypothetical protein
MDRQIIYPGQVPLETDLLNTNKNVMIGLSKLSAALLGTGIVLNGFSCIPTGVASLQVQLTAGEIYSLQNIDGTAYSSLAADTTHQIVKQGILLDTVLLTATPPVTAGQSINYLVQATYADTDSNAVVLPYYNASNPSVAYSGPANAGTTNNTVRKGLATVSIKAGIAATTGTQTTPAPDAGNTGMFVVTVANGQTTITAPNISTLAGAPFVTETLLNKVGQASTQITATAGGTSDAITASFNPVITGLVNGMSLIVRATSANGSATPTLQANGTPAKTIVKGNNLALVAGDIAGAGHWLEFQYDLTLDKWILQNPATGINSNTIGIQGALKNLQASSTGLNANVSVSADEIVVEDANNTYRTLRGVALTIAGTSVGANALDAGVIAISTWYSLWVIWNGTTTSGLLSLSATAPTLPAGYTHKALVSWIRTDSTANKYPLSFIQFGKNSQYKIIAASNLTAFPVAASGTYGGATAVAISNFIPPNSTKIKTLLIVSGSANSGAIGPNALAVQGQFGVGNGGSYASTNMPIEFYLESTNIYIQGTSFTLVVTGWELNI